MSKSQQAVLAIMITFIGAILIYLLWVTPSERLCFLGFCEPEQPAQGVSDSRTIFETSVGYIGRLDHQELSTIELNDISVKQPITQTILKQEDSLELSSNILVSGSTKYSLVNWDVNNTNSVRVVFNVTTRIGNPSIKIVVNGVTVYDELVSAGESKNVKLPLKYFKGDDIIEVVCQYHGLLFWESQYCGLEGLKVIKESFDKSLSTRQREFSLSDIGLKSKTIKIKFFVSDESDNSNELIIKINDEVVYNGKPGKNQPIIVERETSELGLSKDNVISFSAGEGSDYSLQNINLVFSAAEFSESSKTFSFNAPQGASNTPLKLMIKVREDESNVLGLIDFVLRPRGITYEKSAYEGWVVVNVEPGDIVDGENTVKIYSPNGYFYVETFKIVTE